MKQVLSLILVALLLTPAGFAADRDASEAVKAADSIAWSLNENRQDMVVAVSPARQTLQIAGSAGTLLGASISAIANDKYRRAVEEALADYNGFEVFSQRLEGRLNDALDGRAHKVNTLGSTAGATNASTVKDARFAALAAAGHALVLDLDPEYGLFGYDGLLVAKLEARLYDTSKGRAVWADTVQASSELLLASDKLKDPTKQLMPNLSNPRFSISEDSIAQWTGDGGAIFRQRFEEAADACISALLMELGLVQEPAGAYCLGRVNLMRKEFEAAESYLKLALNLDPQHLPAKNALSIAYSHTDRVDEAIALAQEIHTADAAFAPASYNLAWWLALDKNDPADAKPYYDHAKALNMHIPKKLAKAMGD